MNLIHIQGFLRGLTQMMALMRPLADWRGAMVGWKQEQERQLRVLLVLFKQVGGEFSLMHRGMLWLAEYVGRFTGAMLALCPISITRLLLIRIDETLVTGLERAGAQIAIADWEGWEAQSSINPPKVLLDLSVARQEWLSKWAGPVRFL